MWITGRQAQTAATPEAPRESSAVEAEPIVPDHPGDPVADEATWTAADESTPVEGEPETDAEPAPEPDTRADPAQGWASFGHARTAEDVLERSARKPWLDVLLGETATPPHPPAEPAKPALLRELDHDEEPTEAAEPEAYDPDATAVWTLEDVDAHDREDTQSHDDEDDAAEPPVEFPVDSPAEPEPIPELASIPVSEARPVAEPAPFAAPLTEAPAARVDIGWPEEPDDGWEDVAPPVGGQAAYIARWGSRDDWQTDVWEPDRWQSTEPPVADDPPVLEVAAAPVESTPEAAAPEPVDVIAEPVTPEQPTLFGEQVTEPDLPWDPDSTQDFDWTALEHAGAAPVDDEAVVDVPAREEWYDAGCKLWSSEDGGQTWYTDDGRGWNAETHEDIAPSDAPRSTGPATTGSRSEPSREPSPEPRSEDSPEDSPEASPEATDREDGHGPVIPERVEYKPRASYRPLLGILFALAAVLAVVAIFWAVSHGGRSSIGIAIGVTAFALVFWWGLISWTPTVVSVDGPILEVTRGADGQRFDLRDPDLVIDVDDDTASRSWRATITRPDDTELVIPASAVDPDEFTAIVQHYRGQVEREDHSSR
jgi:hypothetical protein